MASAPLDDPAEHHDYEPENQDGRTNNIGEQTEVWIFSSGSYFDQKEQGDADQAGDHNRTANHADVVAKKAWSFRRNWFYVIHALLRELSRTGFSIHTGPLRKLGDHIETVETVSLTARAVTTGLKTGVNEN